MLTLTVANVSCLYYMNVYQPDPFVSLNHLTRAGINPKRRVKSNKPIRAPIFT